MLLNYLTAEVASLFNVYAYGRSSPSAEFTNCGAVHLGLLRGYLNIAMVSS